MAWYWAALLLCLTPLCHGGSNLPDEEDMRTCVSDNKGKIFGFNKQAEDILAPCKYPALKRQECGEYRVTLTPGNKWIGDQYQMNSIWLSVENIKDASKRWHGRCTNKIAIKFIKGMNVNLFNTKTGDDGTTMKYNETFNQGTVVLKKKQAWTYIEDKLGSFVLRIKPWHPRSKVFEKLNGTWNHMKFHFECKHEIVKHHAFPYQYCGNTEKNLVDDMSKNAPYNMSKVGADVRKRIVIYHKLFTNEDVDQQEPRCSNATNILKNTCKSFDHRLQVLKLCEEILAGGRQTQCVTAYSCHIMDIFNACLMWGCADEANPFKKPALDTTADAACQQTGSGIDLCPPTESYFGSLTQTLKDVNCFKDFIPFEDKRRK